MFHIVQHKHIVRIFCLARKDIKLKMNLCLRFFFFIFSLNLKLSKYAPELRALGWIQRSLLLHMGPDSPCPEDTAGATVPVPQGSPHPAQSPGPHVSPCSVNPCPSDAAEGPVSSSPLSCLAQANWQFGNEETPRLLLPQNRISPFLT